MTYLGVDYGRKRIGLALGTIYPKVFGVLQTEDDSIEKIEAICKKEEVKKIIIGLPTRSQGEAGTLAEEIKEFAKKVYEKTAIPVFFEEEKFTSSFAAAELKSAGQKVTRESGKVDQMAAAMILEQFINKEKELEKVSPNIGEAN